jgi:hypothetical protein
MCRLPRHPASRRLPRRSVPALPLNRPTASPAIPLPPKSTAALDAALTGFLRDMAGDKHGKNVVLLATTLGADPTPSGGAIWASSGTQLTRNRAPR